MSEYGEVFDMPLEDRAYIVRYGNHKASVMMLKRSDYTVEKVLDKFVISTRNIKHYTMFPTEGEAEAFIAERITVTPWYSKFYGRECRCGAAPWGYYEANGIIFEMCRKCKYPLYQICRLRLDVAAVDDVDLNDLLG